jgi:hypothetical protein
MQRSKCPDPRCGSGTGAFAHDHHSGNRRKPRDDVQQTKSAPSRRKLKQRDGAFSPQEPCVGAWLCGELLSARFGIVRLLTEAS